MNVRKASGSSKPVEPSDVYIGEYWFNNKCIQTYQKDPFITDIEITVYDYIRNFEEGGEGIPSASELLEELERVDHLLSCVDDKRAEKSNIFIAGEELIADLEKVDTSGGYSKEEDLDPEEMYARGEGTAQQVWFSHIRVLLHAGELKNNFSNGVGYRLINTKLHPKDPRLKTLMVSKREI